MPAESEMIPDWLTPTSRIADCYKETTMNDPTNQPRRRLLAVGAGALATAGLLLRPCEVSSRIAHAAVLKIADDAFWSSLQHGHVLVGGVA